jgi:hypothetical protein
MLSLATHKRMHCPGQLRKSLHITGFFKKMTAYSRRKVNPRRVIVLPKKSDVAIKTLKNVLKNAAATIQAVDPGVESANLRPTIGRSAINQEGLVSNRVYTYATLTLNTWSRASQSGDLTTMASGYADKCPLKRFIKTKLAVLARMRSLLIMIGAEWASRISLTKTVGRVVTVTVDTTYQHGSIQNSYNGLRCADLQGVHVDQKTRRLQQGWITLGMLQPTNSQTESKRASPEDL